MELTSIEITYLVLSFIFAFLLACILILIKINWKESSISSIFFAVFFLTFYFYQPLILIVDRLKSYVLYYSEEKPHFEIEEFLEYEYIIIGYIGTAFSNFILPIHTDISISGYDTFCLRLWDAIKRFIKGKSVLVILLIAYIIFSYSLYKIKDNDEEIEKKSSEFIPFLLNCLIIQDFFKAIWYLGAYFPLLICELRIELDDSNCLFCHCDSSSYAERLKANIEKSLNKDKDKFYKAYGKIDYIIENFYKNNVKKNILDLLIEVESKKDNLEVSLDKNNKELQKLSKEIDPNNVREKLASAVRSLIKVLSKIPRKIYEYKDIDKRLKRGIYNLCYHLLYGVIIIGFFIFIFEVSLSHYDYEDLSSPLNFKTNFLWAFFITFLYFSIIYFSVLKKNSLTRQNIYGICQSDSLCLLKFAEIISGMITPVSFLAVGTKALGIFALRENMTFMQNFDIPLVENVFIGLKFDEIYDTYISIRTLIFLTSFFMTFCINTLSLPLCCKKGKYIINWKINDKNAIYIFDEDGCCERCYK